MALNILNKGYFSTHHFLLLYRLALSKAFVYKVLLDNHVFLLCVTLL
jgi:hypothetical protein